jgi:hypothetical protein
LERTSPGRRQTVVTPGNRTLAFGIAAVSLAACSGTSGGSYHPAGGGSPTQAPPSVGAHGVITGRFLAVGGPYGAQPSTPTVSASEQ